MIPTDAITLTAAIAARAAVAPDTPVMNFLAAGQPSEPLRIGQLHTAALAVAGRLVEAGIVPGDVVLVVAEHDARLVTLFLGALYAGATPSIAPYPSAFSQAERYQQRLLDMAHVSQARAVLALSDVLASLVSPLAEFGCIVLDGPVFTAAATGQAAAAPFTPLPTAPAYVQFSSGTTGSPKGAVVSQTAALRHLRTLVAGLELTADDVLVGWAPFYHDLGLVIYLLLPLVSGILAVTMAPDYWVRRPQVLLRALHDYRGTVCIMPNFGFAHTTRNVRPRDSEGLDLRCVRHLIAGAEVVQAETLDAFAARFQPSGLAPEALGVGYGMTECVFMATITPTNQPPRVDHVARQALLTEQRALPSDAPDALPAVSCGFPLPETTIAILDDHGHPLPERQVGEVVITSPTLCDGYLHHPDLTASTLRAGRLYTGDLGYLAAGELFVVDRKKDLIIAAGKHIYPETLEQLALAELGAPGGRAAAFGVRSVELGTEAPVLVCEVRGQAAEADASTLITKIRRRVQQGADVALADVRLVRRGWLEITTSGKVSRSATRIRYLAAGYRPEPPGLALLRAADDDPVLLEQALTALVGGMLGLDTVAPHDSFFALGGDSLTALRFVLAVEEATGRRVPTEFFREPTVAHLASVIPNARRPDDLALHPVASRTFGKKNGNSPSVTPRRMISHLTSAGPIWRGHGMPYGLGVRVQRMWIRLPLIRQKLLRRAAPFQEWLTILGRADPDGGEFELSLLANTWRSWREACVQQPSIFT